jgi:type IV pilus assembly protein PilV
MNNSEQIISSKQSGSTLIEVLITVLVLSIGLLGMATLQFEAVKRNNDAYLRSQAVNLAYDMTDRIRVNRTGASDNSYVIAIDAAAPSGSSAADQDLKAWLDNLARELPSGDGFITKVGNEFTITVCWDETRDGLTGSDPCFSFISGI